MIRNNTARKRAESSKSDSSGTSENHTRSLLYVIQTPRSRRQCSGKRCRRFTATNVCVTHMQQCYNRIVWIFILLAHCFFSLSSTSALNSTIVAFQLVLAHFDAKTYDRLTSGYTDTHSQRQTTLNFRYWNEYQIVHDFYYYIYYSLIHWFTQSIDIQLNVKRVDRLSSYPTNSMGFLFSVRHTKTNRKGILCDVAWYIFKQATNSFCFSFNLLFVSFAVALFLFMPIAR